MDDFSAELIREAADAKMWARGVGYFDEGRVLSVERRSGWVYGLVAGTVPYRCKLRVAGKGLSFDCDCPVGADGVLCKHVVATGLAYLNESDDQQTDADQPSSRKHTNPHEDIQRYLEGLCPEALVQLVMERLDQDEDWREVLVRTAAVHRPGGVDLAGLKQSITKATRTGPFLDYYAVGTYADGLVSLCESLDALIATGHADAAIKLIEYALERCEDALNRVDDSNGEVGGVLRELEDLHLKACQQAKHLKPKKLARRLFRWRVTTDWDTFHNAPETYAEVLGEKGLAEFRALAEQQWQKLPELGPGDNRLGYDTKRSTLTALMQSLARQAGDVDELIRVLQKDTSAPYRFLQIADTCFAHERLDEAIRWAQRGVEAFPDEQRDTRLHALLADLYRRAKRFDEAVELAWWLFDLNPGLPSYTRLKSHAESLRANGRKSNKPWRQWRERALARLREDIARLAENGPARTNVVRYPIATHRDHSRLVEIYLWEDDVDSAWRDAQAGGCSDALWLKLAQRRESTHPADAVAVYQELAASCIEQTNTRGYQEAVALIQRLLPLMSKAGLKGQRQRYLATLKTSYKRKRKFIQMLEAAVA